MLLDVLWEAAVAVDVREVELAAGREDAVRLVEHRGLVGAQVDHAVGDDHVHRLVLDARGGEVFDVALDEAHVGCGVADGGGELVRVRARHVQLLVRHVQARHTSCGAARARMGCGVCLQVPCARAVSCVGGSGGKDVLRAKRGRMRARLGARIGRAAWRRRTRLANELARDVAVTARAAAEVEHAQAVNAERQRCATAVELGLDLLRNGLHDLNNVRVRPASCGAGARLEVLARLEHLAVVLLHALQRLGDGRGRGRAA